MLSRERSWLCCCDESEEPYDQYDEWTEDPEGVYWQDWTDGHYSESGSPQHLEEYGEHDGAFDEEAIYYGDEVADDVDPEVAGQQAEEYDSAFAAYLDARKRFNNIKLSRGYLPIVALTDANSNLAPGISPSSSPSSSKGHKGKGKGKPKGKGKGNVVRYPPRGKGKDPDPKGRAQSAMTCLHCGQQGHLTYNCPVPRSASPTKKRAAPTESTVADVEHGHVLFMS